MLIVFIKLLNLSGIFKPECLTKWYAQRLASWKIQCSHVLNLPNHIRPQSLAGQGRREEARHRLLRTPHNLALTGLQRPKKEEKPPSTLPRQSLSRPPLAALRSDWITEPSVLSFHVPSLGDQAINCSDFFREIGLLRTERLCITWEAKLRIKTMIVSDIVVLLSKSRSQRSFPIYQAIMPNSSDQLKPPV